MWHVLIGSDTRPGEVHGLERDHSKSSISALRMSFETDLREAKWCLFGAKLSSFALPPSIGTGTESGGFISRRELPFHHQWKSDRFQGAENDEPLGHLRL